MLLGDLFERPVEPDESLKSRLIRILKGFRHRPLANVGNHDIRHTRLSDGDSLAMLAVSDVLDAVPESGPRGALPAGRAPDRARRHAVRAGDSNGGARAVSGADHVVWLTHHDLAFGAGYPGAVPPEAIQGCALALNGHVHKRHAPVRIGDTLWVNPGNITRGSVDLIAHVPAVFVLSGDLSLAEERLPHTVDVFDLTGRQVAADASPEAIGRIESAFVSLLQAETTTDLARSDDGALIREEIEAKFSRDETPERCGRRSARWSRRRWRNGVVEDSLSSLEFILKSCSFRIGGGDRSRVLVFDEPRDDKKRCTIWDCALLSFTSALPASPRN